MRTKNSIKNIVYGMTSQIVSTLINFISRTIFIKVLGMEYLGVNGLFTNILSMLSLAELGIGSAIIYNMYKPLAENNKEMLKSLMNLYSKAYRIIGILIFSLGVLIVPFLENIIKDTSNVSKLEIIYLLFLINSVVSYFYAYKSSIIIADQKNYIITIKQQIFIVIQVISQIVALLLTKNYIIYLIIQIICTLLLNISISKKADEIYGFLKEKNVKKLDTDNKKRIFKHVSAMMSHKFGTVVVNSTDNILISTFAGVYWVGLYSNYSMIISIVNRFISQIFTAITASIGNLNAMEGKEKSYNVYKKILFINFWIYGFCTICLWILLNPFIKIWLGNKFILSDSVVLIIVMNFYIMGMRTTTITYNTTLGLFWNDRFKPWIEAIINIVVSIILLRNFGMIGVLLGTLISTIATSFWVDPYILYKHGFNKKLRDYFKEYTIYTFILIITALITKYISNIVICNIYLQFIYKLIICLVLPNILFFIFFIKRNEFKELLKLLKNILKINKLAID